MRSNTYTHTHTILYIYKEHRLYHCELKEYLLDYTTVNLKSTPSKAASQVLLIEKE